MGPGIKEIALTFDDGPSEETWKILDFLKKEKIRATFFVVGKKISKNRLLLRKMLRQKCEIANHSFDHANLFFKSRRRMLKSIIDTDSLLNTLGVKSDLIRPPHLLFGPGLLFLSKNLTKR